MTCGASAQPGYPFTTPRGVSRRTGRTRDIEAAMTASMSSSANAASSATVFGSALEE